MIKVSKISTQKIAEEGVVLRGRTEEDIANMIHYVLFGNSFKKPIMTGSRGFCESGANNITTEVINTQILYNKRSGLRVRGFIITIPATDLHSDLLFQELAQISFNISSYFFYKGFQTVYGVFRERDHFSIWYVINTVSYEDGSKFIINNSEKLAELYACAQSVVNRITGVNNPEFDFDFSSLEHYPYYYEMNRNSVLGENNT